jgi:hypothetical protein
VEDVRGTTSARAEEALGALDVERFADLYLRFRESDATVKVRHGLLDATGLLTVDDDRLMSVSCAAPRCPRSAALRRRTVRRALVVSDRAASIRAERAGDRGETRTDGDGG